MMCNEPCIANPEKVRGPQRATPSGSDAAVISSAETQKDAIASLRQILIGSFHEIDATDSLHKGTAPETPIESRTHSRTSSIAALPVPNCEGSDLSTSEDEQSSVHSFQSDTNLLQLEDDLNQQELKYDTATDVPDAAAADDRSFMTLRVTYLLVTLVIMLADGLQGTHLYVLYEGYGFSVASLYCLGFATGGLMSPITGPLVDRIGRKKSAILYCVLEIFINMLEQYPFLSGLIVSRMIGGFTTNLLSSVFETWLDTEYRRRGFQKEKYEIIMRDSVIVSNMAAIFSGYLAHILAERYGAVGPFEGAVTCTAVALVVVCFIWTENYGTSEDDHDTPKQMLEYFKEAVSAFRDDSKMLRVGILQGLTEGSIQIFVFLWAPTLRHFAKSAPQDAYGLDKEGAPAYGLIFGGYMAAGVLGGLIAPRIRKLTSALLSPIVDGKAPIATIEIEGEGTVPVRPMAVEFLASACYLVSAFMLFVPCVCHDDSAFSFSYALFSLVVFEFLIGIFLPCEGVIRSLYFPANARASIMTLPRIIVNVAVAIGVVSTNFISHKTAFFAVGCLMLASTILQLSLISEREWSSLFSRVDRMQGRVLRYSRSFSFSKRKPKSKRVLKHARSFSLTFYPKSSSSAIPTELVRHTSDASTSSTTSATFDDDSGYLEDSSFVDKFKEE